MSSWEAKVETVERQEKNPTLLKSSFSWKFDHNAVILESANFENTSNHILTSKMVIWKQCIFLTKIVVGIVFL